MRHLLATATLLAALTATAHAESHRRVVILRFDGPSQLADDARELVMDAAGHDNDVVALGRWADAHKAASKKLRGAKAWAKSAREAQVDAIIEGSVRRGRHGYQLELVVREAATGNQLDSVELSVDDDRKAERAIEGELTDMLAWVEPPTDRKDVLRLDRTLDRDDDRDSRDDDRLGSRDRDDRDDDRTARGGRGGRDDDRTARRGRDDDRTARRDRDDRDDDRLGSRDRDDDRATRRDRDDRDDDRTARRDRDDRDDDRTARRNRDDRDDDRTAGRDRDDRDDRDDARGDDDGDRGARRGDDLGFAADDNRDDRDDDRDLADETVALLDGDRPRSSRSADEPAGKKAMLRVAGGGYVTSRTLGLAAADGGAAAGADGGHPTMGLALAAELFPFGETGAGHRLTGLGLRLDIAHALGNKVAAQVDGAPAQLGVDQTTWSAALAYRRPLDPVTVQLDLGYGSTSQTIVDKPMTVAVVDAAYSYVRAGGRVELPINRKATVGAGAHYLYLTGAPEMQKLGAPSATGLEADASVEVPLTPSLTAIAGLDYQRISLSFTGATASASSATDSFVSGRVGLGFTY